MLKNEFELVEKERREAQRMADRDAKKFAKKKKNNGGDDDDDDDDDDDESVVLDEDDDEDDDEDVVNVGKKRKTQQKSTTSSSAATTEPRKKAVKGRDMAAAALKQLLPEVKATVSGVAVPVPDNERDRRILLGKLQYRCLMQLFCCVC
jgi:hypothetical protein